MKGGIKAVVWTDAVQMCILLVGLTALAVMGCVRAGGGEAVWRIAVDTGRINYDESVSFASCVAYARFIQLLSCVMFMGGDRGRGGRE